jgi:hypothetical protein
MNQHSQIQDTSIHRAAAHDRREGWTVPAERVPLPLREGFYRLVYGQLKHGRNGSLSLDGNDGLDIARSYSPSYGKVDF